MITLHRLASCAQGKTGSTLTFADDVARCVKHKTGTEVQVAVPIGGNPNHIGWSARYDNLGALEIMQVKLMTDPK